MLAQLDKIEQEALSALDRVDDQAALEAWRVAHLGRSSPLMQVFEQLSQLAREDTTRHRTARQPGETASRSQADRACGNPAPG